MMAAPHILLSNSPIAADARAAVHDRRAHARDAHAVPAAAPEVPFASPSGLPLHLLTGRLTQIDSGPQGGGSTVATAWVRSAQRQRQPVAWVQWQGGSLYPPDLHAQGVALEALLVVHVGTAFEAHPRLRAAELLLRSGGFGLVIVDVTCGKLPRGLAWQQRLQHCARTQHCAIVLLTSTSRAPWPNNDPGTAPGPSLGAFVALQLQPQREPLGQGLFVQHCAVGKNKSGLIEQPWQWLAAGPKGLR